VNFEILEKWFPLIAITLVIISYFLHIRYKSANGMSLKETLANVSTFIVWKYVFFIGGEALQFSIYAYFAKFSLTKFENSPTFFIFSVIALDFAYYWKHRYEHQISFLWCQHAIHHSSREFNFSTSLRLPWVGSYLTWMFFIPLVLLGFSPLQVLIGYKVILTYQYLIHTEYLRNLGPLELILNTPSNHRVHHGRNQQYVDKNYGGIFIIWDRLFGTYEPEIENVEFGTLNEMKSKNPIMINFQPWIDLYNNAKKRKSFGDQLKYIFFP
jgi:sterol desaturase/sphingolipid hydroxylase (fatty acid hydroxylase superfamily)